MTETLLERFTRREKQRFPYMLIYMIYTEIIL